jgi:hypothetical protein
MDPAKMKIVYAITSREAKPGSANATPKKYWHRVGVAFVNRDGSLSVKLEALPVSGELHIRDYLPASEPAAEPPALTSRRHGASAVL